MNALVVTRPDHSQVQAQATAPGPALARDPDRALGQVWLAVLAREVVRKQVGECSNHCVELLTDHMC